MSDSLEEELNTVVETSSSIESESKQQPQEFTSKILDFLSTASNEKLSACALGLGVATYFVLGRVGLVLIGAVGGIALHATLEGGNAKDNHSLKSEQKRKKEASLDVVRRLLDWQDVQSRSRSLADDTVSIKPASQDLNFDDFQPETAAALKHIVERAIDDYVKWWYTPILPVDLSFPQSCQHTLTSFLLSFSNHLAKKRPEDVFLNFLTNGISIFIVFLGELSRALMAQAATGREPGEAIALYLTDHPDSSFASVLDRAEQTKKLKAVSEDILQTFLEPTAYQYEPARLFLKEVLAGLILEPTLVNCSKAEWINGWIVYLLEQGEPEIMNAINAGVGEATGGQGSPPKSDEKTSTSHPKSVEVSGIDDEDREALEEVKRLNALIASEQFQQPDSASHSHDQPQITSSKDIDEVVSSAPSSNTMLTPTSSQSDLAGSKSYTSLDEKAGMESFIEPAEDSNGPENPPMTSFDQIVPQDKLFTEPTKTVPLTLHKGVVTIFDDSQPSDKSTMRSKPTVDYLLQVEPASTQYPGWMIARKYTDFETLHEVLRRISVISGVPEFNTKFSVVPSWKGQTKNALRVDLEAYLKEALSHPRLAESEGMKRFLEKDQGLEKLGNSKGVLGFPSPEAFQSMGKGMLDVLASAPKGAAGGGKAFLDGMKGVGGVFTGQRKSTSRPSLGGIVHRSSEDQLNRLDTASEHSNSADLDGSTIATSRTSADSSKPLSSTNRSSTDTLDQPASSSKLTGNASRVSLQQDSAISAQVIPEEQPPKSSTEFESETLSLPPRPDEIDEQPWTSNEHGASGLENFDSNRKESFMTPKDNIVPSSVANNEDISEKPPTTRKTHKLKAPFSNEETAVAVELIFAAISELYTLSSVWNIRKALLHAAKAFLVRPGNPSLEQIRKLLQESVIEANTTDSGIAYQLRKLRENSLPTEAEFAQWPPPLSDEAKESLRRKARRLLVEQGLPPALRGIMGAQATGEALGRLFDSLQVEEVARGLLFAVMLQSIRAVTH